MNPHRRVLAALLVTVLAATMPASAYVVVMRDGSQLLASEPYRIEDGRALIVLETGTVTFIDAAEIDEEATRIANEKQVGSALILEDGEVRSLSDAPPPPASRRTLADLIEEGETQAAVPAGTRREQTGATPRATGDAPLQRRGHPDLELAADLRRPFLAAGIGEVQIYAGSAEDRPFLEITTGSEAAVFRALRTAAEVLVRLEPPLAGRVAAIDLAMVTPDGDRAGQFRLTRDLARELTDEGVEISTFFVDHVQF